MIFGRFGILELVLILVILLVVFGAKRLPDVGKGIGAALKNFKKASLEDDKTDEGESLSGRVGEKKEEEK